MTIIEPSAPPAASGAERFRAIVNGTRRWILRAGLAAAVAAGVIVYAIVRHGFPEGSSAVLATIGIVAAVAPPLILAAFWVALGELVRLPNRLRQFPLEAREHGEQLRALLDRARIDRGRRFHIPRIPWQLTRTTSSTRELLTPYAPLLPLVSLPFLAATAVATFAAAVEVIVACIVALVLVLG